MSYPFLISLVGATFLAHLILLDVITLVMFDKAYKLRSSSFYSLLGKQ